MTFTGLGDGAYRFNAEINGADIPSTTAGYFTLSSSQKVYSGTATLMTTGTVSVNFTTNAKTYGETVRLQLFVNNDRWYNQIVSDSGIVTFENIPEGTYELVANGDSSRVYGSEKFANGIVVNAGQTTSTEYSANIAKITPVCKNIAGQQVYGNDVTVSVDYSSDYNTFTVDSPNKQALIWQLPDSNQRNFYASIQGSPASSQQNITGDATVTLTAQQGGTAEISVLSSSLPANACVIAEKDGLNPIFVDVVNGKAVFNGLLQGQYRFLVYSSDLNYSWQPNIDGVVGATKLTAEISANVCNVSATCKVNCLLYTSDAADE